jgi:hypothetical protein
MKGSRRKEVEGRKEGREEVEGRKGFWKESVLCVRFRFGLRTIFRFRFLV